MSKSEKAGNKEKDKKKPERGVETMFRVITSAHQRLLDMADGKAHILITVNSIILSAIIGLVLRKLEDSFFFDHTYNHFNSGELTQYDIFNYCHTPFV